jgi:ATP-dependent Clp protease ATP-binding subunit ClpC
VEGAAENSQMWTTVDQETRQIIFDATTLAQEYSSREIKPEHFLLTIFTGGPTAALRMLQSSGVDAGSVAKSIYRRLSQAKVRIEDVPQLSQEAKRAVDFAFDEARRMKSREIGSTHFLLGIARGANKVTSEILEELGLDIDTLRMTARLDQEKN